MPFLPTQMRPCAAERTISTPMPGMVRERLDEVRVELVDLLERHPLVAGVEVDEREVAAGDDDQVRRLGRLVAALAGRRGPRLLTLDGRGAAPGGELRRPRDPCSTAPSWCCCG